MAFIIKGEQLGGVTIYLGKGTKDKIKLVQSSVTRARIFHFQESAIKFFYKNDFSLFNDYTFFVVNTISGEETELPWEPPEQMLYLEDVTDENSIREKF